MAAIHVNYINSYSINLFVFEFQMICLLLNQLRIIIALIQPLEKSLNTAFPFGSLCKTSFRHLLLQKDWIYCQEICADILKTNIVNREM